MKFKYLISVSIVALFSCKKEEIKPKVKYTPRDNKMVVKDTSKMELVDLPIHFKGSSALIYPVGSLTVDELKSRGNYDSNSYKGSQSFSVSNFMDDEITGFLTNLKFQTETSDTLKVLTDKNILIERVSYVNEAKTLVYVLEDEDSNQDNILDENDLKVLYVSNENGTNFIKLSPELHQIIDWNYIQKTNKIYFRSLEDSNKNGNFDKKDKFHFYYYDLKNKEVNEIKL